MNRFEAAPDSSAVPDPSIRAAARTLPSVLPRQWTGAAAGLSSAQQRLWFLAQVQPDSAAYNLTIPICISGSLDTERLANSLRRLVEQHETLRTVFGETSGVPFQEVLGAAEVPLRRIDLSAFPADRLTEERDRALAELAARPFDLEREVFRATLVILGASEHILAISVHHLVADGWSQRILVRDLQRWYAGKDQDSLPEPLVYRDYVVWEREHVLVPHSTTADRFWTDQLSDAPAESRIPGLADEEQGFRGARAPFRLSAETLRRVTDFAKAEGATTFTFIAAAMQVLVARLSGQDDVVIAAPMANRPVSETRRLVGMFVNTVPLRARLGDAPGFREHLRRTRDMVEAAKLHQHVPFDRILDRIELPRDVARQPLCQVMINYLGRAVPAPNFGAAATRLLDQVATGWAQYDLALHLQSTPSGELTGWFEYRTERYDASLVTLIGERFGILLDAALAAPDRPVTELDVLPAGERARLLELSIGPEQAREAISLHDLIVRQAESSPDRIAVRDEHEEISYAELVRRGRRTAAVLAERGVVPGDLVAVCGLRSVDLVTGMFGVLLVGGAYLPVDVDHPAGRISHMLTEAAVRLALTDEAGDRTLASIPDLRSVPLAAGRSVGALGVSAAHAGGLAYVIYTSGSTGRPKGVAVPHRGIVNRLLWMQEAYRLGPDDVVLQKTPYTFDVSVWEFFWPLLAGARLVMARPEGHKDPEYLAEVIGRERVSTVHFVPSMLHAFAAQLEFTPCPSLRRVICSGEALPSALAERFATVSAAELHNLYGPTEASVDVTAWRYEAGESGATVPIGRPITNTRVVVLDGAGGPAPMGTPGELHIGGVCLAREYFGRPDMTAERFIAHPLADPADPRLYRTGDLVRWTTGGALEFLGRIDFQVKLRGFRIELGEIEVALTGHESVAESVVVMRTDGTAPQLVGYVTASSDDPPSEEELRAHLVIRVPEYMVPSRVVVLDEMPLSRNGKLARAALPPPVSRRAGDARAVREPESRIALRLRVAWAEALGMPVERIGADDTFFQLGGDSILSIRLRALLRADGLDIDVPSVFQHPALEDMAEHVRLLAEEPADEPASGLPVAPADLGDGVADSYPLSALQAGMIFHSEFTADSAVYQVTFDFHLRLRYEHDLFQATVDDLVARHDILRTRFDLGSFDDPVQVVQLAAKLPVALVDLRGLSAEDAQQRVDDVFVAAQDEAFDLTLPPLLRLRVVLRRDDDLDLVVSFHDAIFDGWSAATFMTELFEDYLARLRGNHRAKPAPQSSYRDFIVAERAAAAAEPSRTYWDRLLDGATFLALPRPRRTDAPVIARSVDVPAVVPADLLAAVTALAASAGVTLKTVMLAAYVAALARTGATHDVLTGLVSGGRPEVADGDRILGQFLNTVPLRLDVRRSWRDLIAEVFRQESDSFPHRRYPLTEMQRAHRGEPLFEAAFNYVHFHVYQRIAADPDVRFLDGQFTDPFHFPMTVNIRINPFDGQTQIVTNYNDAHLDESQAHTFARQMIGALTRMTTAPDEICAVWAGVAENDAVVPPARTITAGSRAAVVRRPGTAGEPADETEALLLRIWQQVLRTDDIGVGDDFFELGGDSILSIQVCARARRAGVSIRPKDVFDNTTVRRLSDHLRGAGRTTAARPVTDRPIPISAAQQVVLADEQDRGWDNVSVLLRLTGPMSEPEFRLAVADVVARHESLRSRFRHDGTTWSQEAAERCDAVPAWSEDSSGWLDDLHRSLDLTAGPVIRIAHHTEGDEAHLGIVAHHAVADAYSLQIIAVDLAEAYAERAAGRHPIITLGPTLGQIYRPVSENAPVRTSPAGSAGTQETECAVEAHLDAATTERLLRVCGAARLTPDHLLAAVVSDVHRAFTGLPAGAVDVMTSGRTGQQDPDISDAVGCLAYPVTVPVPMRDDLVDAARDVRDGMRHRRAGAAPVLVNYFGQVLTELPEPLTAIEADGSTRRGPGRPRTHEIELAGAIVDGRMRLHLLYSAAAADRAAAGAALGRVAEALTGAADAKPGGVAPAVTDFDLSGLDSAELGSLLDHIAGRDR